MNGRQAKRLRKDAMDLAVQWLKTLVPDDQKDLITPKSIVEFEKGQDLHVYANGTMRCSAYSRRYFYKALKRAFYYGVDSKMFLVDAGRLG